MRHRPLPNGESILVYTYSFEVAGDPVSYLVKPLVAVVFYWQTYRRFGRLRKFLLQSADEVRNWQMQQRSIASKNEILEK